MYRLESKKSECTYSLAFSILAGSFGLSFLKSSTMASSALAAPSLSRVRAIALAASHTRTLVRPVDHRASIASFVMSLFLWTTTPPSASITVSAASSPLTSSSAMSFSMARAPRRSSTPSSVDAPKIFSSSVAGIFFLLSMFTLTESPLENENSSHAPRSGMIFAEYSSCPEICSSLEK